MQSLYELLVNKNKILNGEVMGWYNYNPKDVVNVYEDEYVVVDYNKSGKMYRVTIFEDGHFVDEFWFDEYKEDK